MLAGGVGFADPGTGETDAVVNWWEPTDRLGIPSHNPLDSDRFKVVTVRVKSQPKVLKVLLP